MTVKLPRAVQAIKDRIAEQESAGTGTNQQEGTPAETPGAPASDPAQVVTQPAAPAATPATNPELDALRAQVDRLTEQMQTTLSENHRLSAELEAARASVPPPRSDVMTEAENVLGPDATAVVSKVIREEVARAIDPMRAEIAPVVQREKLSLGDFQAQVDSALAPASYYWLQSHGGFMAYFSKPDATGAIRGDQLNDAITSRDVRRTVELYAGFAKEIGLQVKGIPGDGRSGHVTGVPLEQREAPSGASSAPASSQTGEGKRYRRAEVAAFYKELSMARAQWNRLPKKVQDEWVTKERDIVAAAQQGRIIP